MRIGGSRVVVTGASSGIGLVTAKRLAAMGADVIAVARSERPLKELASSQPKITAVVADVTDAADRAALIEAAGEVDVLVNNAGVGWTGLVEHMSMDDVRRLYETNVLSLIDLTMRVLPTMLERRRGRIVNVSSAAAWVAHPPISVYASTKWAVQGFSEGLQRELNGRPVTVCTVNPGPVATHFGVAARNGNRPIEDLPDERMPGVPASWVARAVAHAIRYGAIPGYRRIAVPRLMGFSRLGSMPFTQWTVDAPALIARERRRQLRSGREGSQP